MTYEIFHIPTDYDPETEDGEPYPDGWYWWTCQPGCLPDGEAVGPFDTEGEAELDALGEGLQCHE